MRLRAGMGVVCGLLAGCQHLPDGVTIDLDNRTVAVGACTCRLPTTAVLPAPPVPPAGAPAASEAEAGAGRDAPR